MILLRLHLPQPRYRTMVGKLFIKDLLLMVYRLKHINLFLDKILAHIKESIEWNFGLNDDVSMLEVQCVDQ